MSLLTVLSSPSTPPAPSGPTPTGDQNTASPAALTGTGLGDPIALGAWVPEGFLAAGYNYAAGAAYNVPTADRQTVQGPYLMPISGTLTAEIYAKGGTNAQKLRIIGFQMFQAASTTRAPTSDTDPATSANRPITAILAGAEFSIGAGEAAGWRGTWSAPVAADDQIAIGIWCENVATGAQLYRYTANTRIRRYRNNSGARPYSTAGVLTDYPSTSIDSTGEEFAIRLLLTPTPLSAPATINATANTDRSISVAWDAVPNAERYRLERSVSGADTWSVAAIASSLSWRDPDLANGVAYDYRVITIWYNSPSSASVIATATAGGGRVAYDRGVLVEVASNVNIANPLRGRQGGTNLPEVDGGTNHITYSRGFELGDYDTSPTHTGGSYNWSAIDAAKVAASAVNRRFWFRTRMSVPGSGNTLPGWMTANAAYYNVAGDGTYYPAYNNADVITGMNAAATAKAARYGADSVVALHDISYTHQYGEMSGQAGSDPPSAATLLSLMTTAEAAYATSARLVVNLPDYTSEATLWALLQAGVHLRYDGMGETSAPAWYGRWTANTSPRCRAALATARWVVRVGELIVNLANDTATDQRLLLAADEITAVGVGILSDSNMQGYGGISLARQQAVQALLPPAGYRLSVTTVAFPSPIARENTGAFLLRWHNRGSAPLIESRTPMLQLRQGGAVVWETALDLDLSSILPKGGALDTQTLITIPASVEAGTYDVCVHVPAVDATIPALALCNADVQSGTYYVLAAGITVS